MRNIFAKLPKKLLVFMAFAIIALGIGATSSLASPGPDRPTRAWTAAENGFDYVTFNSFTGVPNGIGDERDFLRATINGSNQTWTDPVGPVQNNEKITGKIYIHNNADPLLNEAEGQPGIARDVNVKIELPTGLQTDHEVTSFISASNAQPETIYDTLDVTSINNSLFELGFVPGSARLGGLNGTVLSDEIFTTGINIGDQNGCFEFVQEITFELEVKKPGYILQKTGRIKGEGPDQWRKVVNAERGDVIEWRIYFENIGTTVLEDVTLTDDLPTYTTLTPGSVELVNATHRDGYFFGPGAVQDNGDRVNIDIDDYSSQGGNAYIYMESTINDDAEIQCGNFQVANVAYAIPNYNDYRLDTINSSVKVNILNDDCEEPEVVAICESLTANKLTVNVGEEITLSAKGTTAADSDDNDNDEITNYSFVINDSKGGDSADGVYKFTPSNEGTYTIRATVNFTEYGAKTSDNCVVTITVDKEATPVVACDAVLVSLVGEDTYKFTVETTATNGATVKDYSYDFGDDTEVMLSDNNVVEHTYSGEGTYNAQITVRFNVDGEVVTVKNSNDCAKTITIDEDMEMCEVEGKENLPKDSPDCREQVKTAKKVLPNTGAGSIASAFAAITAAGTVGHSLVSRRRK